MSVRPSTSSTLQSLRYIWQRRRVVRILVGRRAAIWLVIGAFAGISTAVIETILSLQIAQMFSILGVGGATTGEVPMSFAVLLVVIGVLRGLSYFLISQSGTNAYENITLRLRLFAFHEAFRKDTGYVSLARLNYLLAEIFPKATLFCLSVAVMIPNALQAGVVFSIMLYKTFLLTAVGFSGIFVVGILVHLTNVKVRAISAGLPAQYEMASARMTRMAKNWFFLKAVRKMNDEHAVLSNTFIRFCREVMRLVSLGNFAAILPQSFGVLVIVGLIVLQAKHTPLDATAFIAFLYLFFRFIQALGQVAINYSALNSNFPQFAEALAHIQSIDQAGVEQAMSDLTFKPIAAADGNRPADIVPVEPPSIEFSEVSFRYAAGASAIENFSLRVSPGERVALMGPSGAGKSTVLALCMGVLRPTAGTIKIAGIAPEEWFDRFGSRLGYVGSEPYLIEGSVEENLTYGLDRPCSREELLAVLRQVGLGQWSSERTEPLAHRLHESGEGLSTGQKQRLMLARALLRKPALIVLDEMSANLDRKSELEIKELITALSHVTILTVSHRLEFVSGNHRIVELPGAPGPKPEIKAL
jgi:ABC-type multidrug transport system fused ATPase/permease subunit